jgi:YcaO-like protein with predicted kinase domain
MNSYNRFKDSSPIDTVNKCKKVLSDLNISYTEDIVKNPNTNIYSIHINVDTLNFSVSGKGSTEEYCLASGYGELLERLLMLHFDYFLENLHPWHDAKCISLKEYFESYIPKDVLLDVKTRANIADGKYPKTDDLVNIYKKYFNSENIDVIPFYDVVHNDIVYLSNPITRLMYSSNGLSFGNTLAETLVQALCEILERHITLKFLMEELTPPQIPKNYIQKEHPYIFDIINDLESNEDFNVYLYDCSIKQKFPVVCCVFVNKKTGMYRYTFGSHPAIEIAMERCLTEMFQGAKTTNQLTLNKMCVETSSNSTLLENTYQRFRRHGGYLPLTFFKETPSYEFVTWKTSHIDNKNMAKELIDLLVNEFNRNIYIRAEKTFAGYSVRVIVPEWMSTTHYLPRGYTGVISYDEELIINGLIVNRDLTPDEIEDLHNLWLYPMTFYIEKTNIPREFLLAASYYDKGDISNSVKWLSSLHNKHPVFDIIQQFLEMILQGCEANDILNTLSLFYKYSDIELVKNMLSSKSMLKYMLDDREQAKLYTEQYNILSSNIKNFCDTYKMYMKEHSINQLDCKELLHI